MKNTFKPKAKSPNKFGPQKKPAHPWRRTMFYGKKKEQK